HHPRCLATLLDFAEVDSWNPASGQQFQQVLLLEDTILQLPGGFFDQQTWYLHQSQSTSPIGSDYTQVYTINYTNLFANNKFNKSEIAKLSEEESSIVESFKKESSKLELS
ncbi:9301_t:CDS:2, partial [Dentiscutata erythropus]